MKPTFGNPTLRFDVYRLVQGCVERAAIYGVLRAFKHSDSPSQEEIAHEVEKAVMDELCEWIEFPPFRET